MEVVVGEFKAIEKPLAESVSVEEKNKKSLFGILKDSIFITGDIVKPIGEIWSVDD